MNTIFLREAPSWAADPASAQKFERNFVEIPRYVEIESGLKGVSKQVISKLAGNVYSKDEAMAMFAKSLKESETLAFVAGRRNRHDLRPTLTAGEIKMLDGRHSRNMKYFSNFCDDVLAGRGRMDYMRRAEMYGESLWSIFTRGESSNWEDDHDGYRFMWVLDPDAEHCATCLERAKLSRERGGFTWDELVEIGFPGEGTDCATRCRCHIERFRGAARVQHPAANLPQPKIADSPAAGFKTFEELMGDSTEPELPAAGVPFVRAKGDLLTRSVAVEAKAEPSVVADLERRSDLVEAIKSLPEPKPAEELLQRLPFVPYTLRQPDKVVNVHNVDSGNPQRIYVGNGLAIVAERSMGAWWLILLMLYDPGVLGDLTKPGGILAIER